MKTIMILIVFMATTCIAVGQAADANVLKGKHELSPGISFQHMKENGSTNFWYLTIPLRWNYFVTNHIGLGTDLTATISTDAEIGVIFSGIMEYNFTGKSKTIPFLLAGAGISNGSLPIDRLALKEEDAALGVFTLGTGLKGFVAPKLLIRVDLQYRQFRGKTTETDWVDGSEYTDKRRVGMMSASLGISLLL